MGTCDREGEKGCIISVAAVGDRSLSLPGSLNGVRTVPQNRLPDGEEAGALAQLSLHPIG